jgi:hypothetical protein
MHCPNCERLTYWPNRIGDQRVKPKNVPEGALLAAILDGTCFTCRRIAKGLSSGGREDSKRERVSRHLMTPEEVQRANQAYQCFTARRRTRGVPREGLHPSTLVRPGLFLMEVN